MHIESYSEHVALLRSLGTLKQRGLSPRGVLFLALSSQGRIYLALPSQPEQLTSESLRVGEKMALRWPCLLYTSPSPRDRTRYRMPSSA